MNECEKKVKAINAGELLDILSDEELQQTLDELMDHFKAFLKSIDYACDDYQDEIYDAMIKISHERTNRQVMSERSRFPPDK